LHFRGSPSNLSAAVRLAYLYSRYPVVSQTFCDTEMLALEKMGVEIEIYSIYAPPTSFRHGHAARLKAPIHYAPPAPVLKLGEMDARKNGRWPTEMIARHEELYGPAYKAGLRARNALYFAELFRKRGITHCHVHFANRAAHTGLFIKAISGIPISISTHGQDFMVDLGNHDLLREMCREAVFIANETSFSKGMVAQLCPDSTDKMLRVFNGMDLGNFPAPVPTTQNRVPKIVSIGRLIEFKGFHHLIAACGMLRDRGLAFDCEIIGEGPWRAALEDRIAQLQLGDRVRLLGALPQEEVFQKLRGCDIFTLACVVDENGASDVFPTVILEAMASAKAVVSTRLAGVPEQIDSGRSGLLVEPGDEQSLADALGRVVQSADLRKEYGEAARRRIETEFAIEKTVLPLMERYTQFVRPSSTPPPTQSQLACLAWQLPLPDHSATEYRQLLRNYAGTRLLALHVSRTGLSESLLELVGQTDFLPDGMVVEGEWQQERELARQMETWRGHLGEALPSEVFLQHARYALFLRKWLRQYGVRHLHALGARELLTAWLLRRLSGITLSATIDGREPEFADSVLQKLGKDCVGLRVALGEPAWVERLESETTGPLITVRRQKRAPTELEPEWIGKLSEWSGRAA
jgi:glycosyltransferase involved in cell wall biosynthesis